MPKTYPGFEWTVTDVRQSEHTDLWIVSFDGAYDRYEDELDLLEAVAS